MPDRFHIHSHLMTEGIFWGAGTPDHRFSAHLDSNRRGIELTVAPELGGPARLFPTKNEPTYPLDVVHGLTTHGPCTLLGLHQLSSLRTHHSGSDVLIVRRFRAG